MSDENSKKVVYTLYNKRLRRQLRHPRVGTWTTPDLNEACTMLGSCKEYVRTLGMPGYEGDFIVVDAHTNEPVFLPPWGSSEDDFDIEEYTREFDFPAGQPPFSSHPG